MISVGQLEQKIIELEHIRVVIRRPITHMYEKEWGFNHKSLGDISIEHWINNRLKPIIGDDEFEIIYNEHFYTNPITTLNKIRLSYNI